MAKIVIAELDINAEGLLKATAKTRDELDKLRIANAKLRKDGTASTQELVKQEVAISNLSTSYREQKKVLSVLNDERQESITLSTALTNELNKKNKSINQARENNKKLLKIRNSLNISTAKGQQELAKINAKLDKNNKFIKDNSDALSKQKINVGNYQGALSTLSPQLSRISAVLVQVKNGLNAQTAAMKTSAVATSGMSKALKIFRLALISTGIGALLVALGSLVTFLSSTQKGIDIVTKVTRPLQAIFQSLVGVFQRVGEALFDAFSNPKQLLTDLVDFIKGQVMNRFQALSIVLEGIINLDFGKIKEGFIQGATGVVDFTDKVKELGKATVEFFAEAIEKGKEIDRLQKSIEQGEAEIILTRAQTAKQLRELQLIANDRTLSAKANNDAADQALILANRLSEAEKQIINDKIRQEEIQQSLNDSGREDLAKLNELRAEGLQADEKARATELKFLTARAGLVKQQRAVAKQQQAEDKQTELDRIKKEEEEAKKKEESEEKEIERIKAFEQRKRDLQDEIDIANAEAGIEKELLKVDQEFQKQIEELERLELNSLEKQELLALLTTQEEQIVQDIKDKFAEDGLKKLFKVDKSVLEAEKAQAKARQDVASLLTGVLIGLLGDSLGAKLTAIALEGAIQAGLVGITSASAQARNFAQATASAPPPFNIPAIITSGIQNVAIQAQSSLAITKIITATALKSVGTIASGLYEGGRIPELSSGRITASQNIPTQRGGDNVLAKVKRGEVILNKSQQQRAGGDAFFRSIGVPSFTHGGTFGIESTIGSPTPTPSAGFDIEQLGEVIAERMNDVKIVAIESEITDAIQSQVDIEDGARF